MARRRSEGRRRRRSRSRRGGSRSRSRSAGGAEPYRLELCKERHGAAEAMFDIQVEDGGERVVPHVCARLGEGYVIRVTNASRRHTACAVTVDGENALLRDGSLIVAPSDSRELPGFLVSKNFVGKEYVKEYRDFRFGKPKVVESDSSAIGAGAEEQPYTAYGQILCQVFEAVLDEEVDSDQELRGQTTFYRGAGLHGSFDDRLVPEGKKKHFLYSSVTVQGPRSAISNSTRGRWWVRGPRHIATLEVRYREAHSLMLLGVDARALGLARCKDEAGEAAGAGLRAKKEEEKEDKLDKKGGPGGVVELCDLTAEAADGPDRGDDARWTVVARPRLVEPVDV